MEENKFFDFEKQKVQTLTLEQLERTHKENDVYGHPIRGIYHYALIQKILELCSSAGYSPEVYDLFAAQNKERLNAGVVILPQVEAMYGEKAVEAHILRRVFANVRLNDFDDETYTTNLAIAFHQKGIQVGFGNMVKICHNQCMLSADKYIATYSDRGTGRGNGVSIEQVLENVTMWLSDAHKSIMQEREKIVRMQSIEVSVERMMTLIGSLTAIRVKCDTRNSEIHTNATYPLNSSQINALTEDLLIRYETQGHLTAWDMYNSATEQYKADRMDIPSLMPQNRAMVAFLDEQFQL